MQKDNQFDVLIIGGGFYGLRIALFLYEEIGVRNILIVEKESESMTRASYVNQARVHNGYHYPRSILTGYRSAVNFPRFVEEYKPAIVDGFDKYYAVAKNLSKVNARQFKAFCDKIGVEAKAAPQHVAKEFNKHLIEEALKVKEYAFDSRILRKILLDRIEECQGITLHTNEEVSRMNEVDGRIHVSTSKAEYEVGRVFNCAYSQINTLHRRSGLPLVGLKHEIAEMCLVELPEKMKDFSVTVMDGPFFSIMPFPSRNLHTLSHVRYTPHTSWSDNDSTPLALKDAHEYYEKYDLKTNYKKMIADVVRYIPSLKDAVLRDTISEVKTILVKSEGDDSRPILFRSDFGISGYACIMGGKLDNIYDAFVELEVLYGKK